MASVKVQEGAIDTVRVPRDVKSGELVFKAHDFDFLETIGTFITI